MDFAEEWYVPIRMAINTGLTGYKVGINIEFQIDTSNANHKPTAFATITYPNRREGTKTFKYAFQAEKILEHITSSGDIWKFLMELMDIQHERVILENAKKEEEMKDGQGKV